ncbi:MAG: GTPase HflX [Bacteroidota bacterium]
MNETTIKPETVVLIGIVTSGQSREQLNTYLDELAFLVKTANGIPVKRFIQQLPVRDPRTYVGSGKLEEISQYIKENEINIALFDDELSGSQIRNIENILECKVLDRTGLILDIFARHARTSYAKTQVELAQYQYLLPRLTRLWTHLSKQKGGIGLKGPGETEIETDRRIIRKRISILREELNNIDRQKITQRKNRDKLVRVALVGYTNTGKSTILNKLAKTDVYADDKLFATLDTTVRRVVIGNLPFLLSDTVGFIRKLPHNLIESFKSTLDEVRESDLLIHIVDISHSEFEEQIQTVQQTLNNLSVADKPTLVVFNKIDAYTFIEKAEDDLSPITPENIPLDELQKTWMAKMNKNCIFISAKSGENVTNFKDLLYQEVVRIHKTIYPYDNFLY